MAVKTGALGKQLLTIAKPMMSFKKTAEAEARSPPFECPIMALTVIALIFSAYRRVHLSVVLPIYLRKLACALIAVRQPSECTRLETTALYAVEAGHTAVGCNFERSVLKFSL